MKPIILRFRGLHSYREQQEVDFRRLAADGLFGIFGPTGAGKSTVTDAMTLALYGNVERAARGTQGIINLAESSCEVAFSFELSGHTYLAQRLFERAKDEPLNARSNKCRLVDETAGLILADKTAEMNQQLEHLLGMDMKRFTQTVVLPQGKFDRFLRLAPAERGNLLEDIFHLQEYGDSLRNQAKAYADELEQQLQLAEKEQELLGDCTPQHLRELKQALATCREQLQAAVRTHEAAQQAWQQAQTQAALAQEWRQQQQALAALQAGQAEQQQLAEKLRLAYKAAAMRPLLALVETRFAAWKQAQQKQQEQASLQQQTALALAQAEQEQQAAQQVLQERLALTTKTAEQAAAALEQANSQAAAAEQHWQQAEQALEAARQADAAAYLAATLADGAPCPVCGSLEHRNPAQAAADNQLQAAIKGKDKFYAAWKKAGQAMQQAGQALNEAQQQQLAASQAVARQAEPENLVLARAAAAQAELNLRLAESEYQSQQQGLAGLREQALAEATAAGFESVQAARAALLTEQEQQALAESQQQYQQACHTATSRLAQLAEELAGFDATKLPAVEAAATAAQQAWQDALLAEDQAAQALAAAEQHSRRYQELQAQMQLHKTRRDTARQLQNLLKGKALVRFLARERLRELAAEASFTIGGLSNQRYQLQLLEGDQGGDFIIVDQYNGGRRRPVATLSGGEIFLVSLSLALALARKIEMQGAPLGFFFLDEGFGTLDEDLLESVMSVLERLASGEHLVGLISHVAEVKARLPRYLEAMPASDEHGSSLRLMVN